MKNIDRDLYKHMITVAELIEQLQNFRPTDFIVLQEDAEGNGFSPLADVDPGTYIPETTWMGEAKQYDTPYARGRGFDDEDFHNNPDG